MLENISATIFFVGFICTMIFLVIGFTVYIVFEEHKVARIIGIISWIISAIAFLAMMSGGCIWIVIKIWV